MKPFDWKRDGVVLAVAMLAPTAFTWLYFVTFAGSGPLTQVLYFSSKVILGVLPIWWVWSNRVVVAGESGEERAPWRWQSLLGTRQGIVAGVVFGGLTILGMLGFYYFVLKGSTALAGTTPSLLSKLADAGVQTLSGFVGMAIFLSFLHAAFEEYYWRWFVFGRLRDGMPWLWAAVMAAVAFALHHVIVLACYIPATHAWLTVLLSLGIAVGGFVWACIYQKTGSLMGAWLAHVCADLGIMWIGYDLCRGHLT